MCLNLNIKLHCVFIQLMFYYQNLFVDLINHCLKVSSHLPGEMSSVGLAQNLLWTFIFPRWCIFVALRLALQPNKQARFCEVSIVAGLIPFKCQQLMSVPAG